MLKKIPFNNQAFLPTNSLTSANKFDLYLKIEELKQIQQVLAQFNEQEQSEKLWWLKQNDELIQQSIEGFLHESLLTLDGVQLDEEALKLATDLISQIKATLNQLYQLLYG